MADLSQFTGLGNNAPESNYTRVQLLYAMLISAATDVATMPDPDALGHAHQLGTIIPFKAILFKYDKIKEAAQTDGLMQVSNNQLVDISASNESPYEVKRMIAAAPWFSGVLQEGQDYTLQLDIQTNMNADIQDISLDWGNGFVSLTNGQEITFSPGSSLSLDFNLRITLQSGELLYSHSRLAVEPHINAITPDGYGATVIVPVTTDAANPVDGETDNLSIQTACSDGLIRRPLLIINGFEAPRLLNFFGTDFEKIIRRIEFPSPTGNRMIDDFLSSGYDLIFLDFRDETASLEHNADVVKQAIRLVNSMKITDEEIYCIGISMGGVVGKLALREMEIDGEDHETRQFVSIDSPMRGANVPKGFRAMINHVEGIRIGPFGAATVTVGRVVDVLADAVATLESPSVRQLLIYHNNADYETFFDYFTSLGALEQCEYLAISNGSQIGKGQGYNAGTKMFEAQGSSGSYFAGLIGINAGIAGFVINLYQGIFGTGARFKATFWALPNGNEAKIYKGRFAASIFYIPMVWSRKKVKVSGTQPFDNAPGGFKNLGDGNIATEGVDMFYPQFCFIPTISTLEIGPFSGVGAPLSDPFAVIDDNEAILALPQTTMNAMVAIDDDFSSPTLDNLEHPTFTLDNTGVLLATMLNGATLSSDIQSRVFNFGDSGLAYDYMNPPIPIPPATSAWTDFRTEPIIDANLSVLSNGKIWVNGGDYLGFTDQINALNASSSTYDVYIRSGYCTDAAVTVTVEEDGLIEVGDWTNVQNKGILHILDKATLAIVAEGAVVIRNESDLIIEEGGELRIGNRGELIAMFGGQITIQEGATLTVKEGGTLRISQYSKLEIQEGGRLILENGAVVQLWDGPLADGRAVIEIKGTLQVNDLFDFTGNGYFHFFPTSELLLPAGHFELEGQGQDFRFIQLEEATNLDFGSSNLELSNGKVAYKYNSRLSIGTGADLVLTNTRHTGSLSAIAISADGIRRMRVMGSIFDNIGTAIEVFNFASPSSAVHSMINNCTFTDCKTAVLIDESGQINILNSRFQGGIHAMLFNKLNSAKIRNCEVLEYRDPNNSSEMIWGAIELRDVPEFDFSGGHIHDNDVGIFAPEWSTTGDLNQTNILLRNQAIISNHSQYGIFMAKGGTDDNGLDYGLVLMDCAQLLDNTVGIGGIDVLLQIDALDNSGTDDPQYWRSNSFKNPANGRLFDICYIDRDDIWEVSAQGNFWFDIDLQSNVQNWQLLKNATSSLSCADNYPSVNIDTDNFVTQQNSSCPSGPIGPFPTPPTVPTGSLCDLMSSNGFVIGQSAEGIGNTNGQSTSRYYHDAYTGLLAALDADESTETAKDGFIDLANVTELDRGQASIKCQKYVDIARILAVKSYENGKSYSPGTKVLQPSSQEGNTTELSVWDVRELTVYPNPSTAVFWVEVNQASGYIELFNGLGQRIKSFVLNDKTLQINMNDFEAGVFYLQWKTANGALIKTRRLVLLK